MRLVQGTLPKQSLNLFTNNVGANEFFSYVGNLVSVEQSLAVLGILTPDFIEHHGCIIWTPNAQEYKAENFPSSGFFRDSLGQLQKSVSRKDIERYANNFPVSQFFHKWEDEPERSVLRVGLSEKEHRLCHLFAKQIEKYWRISLRENFPDSYFEFEISDDLLDEYGVCLTFWQP